MKKEFYLTPSHRDYRGIKLDINTEDSPYIAVGYGEGKYFGGLYGKDLERLAVNILKALNNKKLKKKKKYVTT